MKTIASILTCILTSLALAEGSADVQSLIAQAKSIETDSESWPHYSLIKSDEQGGGYVLERHVWVNDGEEGTFRTRIFDYSEHGELTTEAILKENSLICLLKRKTSTPIREGAKTAVSEERYYFSDGKLVGVRVKRATLAPDQKPDMSGVKEEAVLVDKVENAPALYKTNLKMAKDSISKLPKLMDQLSNDGSNDATDEEEGVAEGAKVQVTVGTFKGIDVGDYFHWNMTNEKGEEVSFYIWSGGDEIDKIAEKPEKYVKRKCRVTWQKKTRNIPEAGGNTEIDELVKFEWLK